MIVKIQNRRGQYVDFDPSKLLPGEFAIVQTGDPNTSDGKSIYICVTAGNVKQLATLDELQSEVETGLQSAIPEFVQEATQEAQDAADRAEAAAEHLETDTTLTVSGKAADAKKTGDEITALKDDFNYYTEEVIPVAASPEGWRLDGTGRCVEASTYKLVKYEVTAGTTLHLSLSKDVMDTEDEGVYQWQNAVGVPSNLPNTALIGTPVSEAVDKLVEVPTGATYLIVSQLKTNATNSVKLATKTGTIKEKIEDLDSDIADINTDITALDEKVDSIEPGLTDEAKRALLACFENVAWVKDNGQSYYNALYSALYNEEPPEPDPEVPSAYTRYDYIRLKKWSEVPLGTYKEQSDPEDNNAPNVGVFKTALIYTAPYDDLNKLSFKLKAGIVPSSKLGNTINSCIFGGGTSTNADTRLGLYLNIFKQWIYLMMHGVERQFIQTLEDVNTIEIINGSATPSTVKINGTSYSFVWQNSNVINSPIYLFCAYNFGAMTNVGYAGAFSRTGEIEITNQNGGMISKLIPVMRKTDNVIGIYDSVKKEFYTASDLQYSTVGSASCIYDVGMWN